LGEFIDFSDNKIAFIYEEIYLVKISYYGVNQNQNQDKIRIKIEYKSNHNNNIHNIYSTRKELI